MNFSIRMKGYGFLSLLLIVMFCSCKKAASDTITIATAANMQFAIKEMVERFQTNSGIPCHVVISSSGKLTAQIREGAPFDILVSANMKYPNDLYERGKTFEAPQIYAYGALVLWSPSDKVSANLDVLKDAEIRHIALANPEIAPYGIAAVESLKNSGIYEGVLDKLVYGESIAQVNQFIVSGAAEVGFTAKSVILSSRLKDQGSWIEIPEHLYTPIAQGIVRIKGKGRKEGASQKFVEFMFSEEGRKILMDYGYKLNME